MINTQNFEEISAVSLNNNAQLVAVSKTKPIEAIKQLYNLGQKHFGENRVQELVEKQEQLPQDIKWHLIGHLQSNKVKYIAKFVYLIHAVDSLKLLKAINKEAEKNNRIINCLLQLHIAEETTKYGLNETELEEIFNVYLSKNELNNVKICGLMGMATFTNNESKIEKEFKYLAQLFDKIQTQFSLFNNFKELSMGMSSDYKIALKNGSTIIRVGSALFA